MSNPVRSPHFRFSAWVAPSNGAFAAGSPHWFSDSTPPSKSTPCFEATPNPWTTREGGPAPVGLLTHPAGPAGFVVWWFVQPPVGARLQTLYAQYLRVTLVPSVLPRLLARIWPGLWWGVRVGAPFGRKGGRYPPGSIDRSRLQWRPRGWVVWTPPHGGVWSHRWDSPPGRGSLQVVLD